MKPRIIRIDNPDDPRVAPFREVRERDVAGRHNGFIAEGEVVLNVLARSRLYRAKAGAAGGEAGGHPSPADRAF